MVNITFDYGRCVKCGRCVGICPSGHLRMTDGGPLAEPGRCMLCLHCAAACPRDAVRIDGARATVPEPMDTLEAAVMSRRSVRRYQDRAPDRLTLQWALDRAAYAPSGGNRRPTRWSVALGRARMDDIKAAALQYCRESGYAPDLLAAVDRGRDPLTCGAPAMILGWEPERALNPGTDTVIALTTAELLLTERGLGTCWAGYMRRIVERCAALRQMLGIPEEGVPVGCLLVGIPSADFPNIPVRPAAQVFWLEEK